MTKSADQSVNPKSNSALRDKAEAALEAGDLDAATAFAEQLATHTLGPWDNVVLGRIALAFGDPKQARERFMAAHDVLPDEGSILVHLASAFAALHKWPHALRYIEGALAQRDGLAELHERRGIYLSNAGNPTGSEQALEKAIDLEPERASAWALLGERRLEKGDTAGAEEAFTKAVQYEPNSPSGRWNLSLMAERVGDLRRAVALLSAQVDDGIDPLRARQRRGLIRLSQGDLALGWQDYASRLKSPAYVSWQDALPAPYWAGEDLADKHLVVWADQGLGEQILAAGMAREVRPRVGALTLACDPRLVSLFCRSFPDMTVVSLEAMRNGGREIGRADWQASLSELGAVLRPDMASFPKSEKYLNPDPARVERYRKALRKLNPDGSLVGISWRSENPIVGNEKSTNLGQHWIELLTTPGVNFVSLQYGDTGSEIAAAQEGTGVRILEASDLDPAQDVDGFAALVGAMDCVVSTSNTTVHVAGALGVPTVALIPQAYGRPWYWFETGETSPWYPSLTVLRSRGDWADLIKDAADRISQHVRA